MTFFRSLPNWAVVALLTGVYLIAGKLGLMLALVHASATAVWPPTGIALAAFLVLGYWVWPGVFVGAFLVNVATAGSVATSLGIAAGNTLEGLVGAFLVNRYAGGRHVFDLPEDILKFSVLGALLSTMVSPTVGVTSLALGGLASWANYGSIWLTWWLGDTMGALVVAPLLVLWATNPRVQWQPGQTVEAAGLLVCLLAVGLVVFEGGLHSNHQNYPIAYLSIPILMWAAFRFGPRETATASFLLSGIALWGTLHGGGPFVRNTPHESLLFLQGFIGFIALLALVFAAMVAGQKQADAAHARLAAIVDSSADAIIGKTLEGVVLSWNAAAERMFGYKAEEVLGRPLTFLIPASRFDEEPAIIKQLRQGERIDHYETVRQRKDGQTIEVSLTISPIKDETGKVIGISNITRDITLQKRMQVEREKLIREHTDALHKVKVLSGLLPLCASCKKIRDDDGYWNNLENYLQTHSEATFTHGICPDCVKNLYPYLEQTPAPSPARASNHPERSEDSE